MVDNAKIKKLVENSFITPAERRELVEYIDKNGVDMKFFDTFNKYLVEATKNRGKKYQDTVKKIDKLQARLDEQVTEEKQEIEEKLEHKLAAIDPADIKTKDRIWNEYYKMLDDLGERYDRGLKDILSEVLRAA